MHATKSRRTNPRPPSVYLFGKRMKHEKEHFNCSQELGKRRHYMEIGEAQLQNMRSLKALVRAEMPAALQRFYEKVRNTPETAPFFSSDSHMSKARSAQMRHWEAICEGNFDADYERRVTAIGAVHARIGLEPRWYVGGYALLVERLVEAVLRENWPKPGLFGNRKDTHERVSGLLVSLLKAVFLDMDLSISVYNDQSKAKDAAVARERMQVLAALSQALEHLSRRDLSHHLSSDLPDAYRSLADHYNNAVDQLSDAIRTIEAAACQIGFGSEEIRTAADDLARRAEQQAAAVEQTAAAVEEISSVMKSATERAGETGGMVEKARNAARQSGEVVGKAVEAMHRIAASSEDISRIIGVIDDIAFQTNLLALNAGVEAARAGDAGRGFAVVAQEVRELAQRSAKAAKEIKELITASGQEVRSGVLEVSRTGETLGRIVESVHDISTNMNAIVDSSSEQSGGLHEINHAVAAIDQKTQQNAAMAEELTASSHSLAKEVESITQMLGEFVIGGREPADHRPPRRQNAEATGAAQVRTSRQTAAVAGNNALKADRWETF